MKKEKKQELKTVKKNDKKLINIINTASDWIIRVVIINVLIISVSLLVVTIIPAVTAGYKLFCSYIKREEEPLFKGFFTNFKENLINKLILSVIVIIGIGVAVLSNLYYQNMIKTNPSIIAYAGFVVTLILGVVIIITTSFIPVILTGIENVDVETTLKTSFYYSIKYLPRTIVMLFVMLMPGLLLITSITMLILVFAGISLPLLSIAIITTKPREILLNMEEKDA